MINDFTKYSIIEEKFKSLFNLILNELTNLGNNFESLHFSSKEIKNFIPKNDNDITTLKKAKDKIINKLDNFEVIFDEIKVKYDDLLEDIIDTKAKFKMSNPNSNKFGVLIESNQGVIIDFQQKKKQAIEEIRENLNLESDNKDFTTEINNIKGHVNENVKETMLLCKSNETKVKKINNELNELSFKFSKFTDTLKKYENNNYNPNYDQLKIDLMKKVGKEFKRRDDQILELTKYINSIVKF